MGVFVGEVCSNVVLKLRNVNRAQRDFFQHTALLTLPTGTTKLLAKLPAKLPARVTVAALALSALGYMTQIGNGSIGLTMRKVAKVKELL
jgi:hypothetical protein